MTKHQTDKRQAVIDAARRLLANRGLHGMSMKLLVESSKVPVGTIYLYFKDKQDILRQVHASVLSEIATAISKGHDSSLPLFEQFQTQWKNLWDYFIQHSNTLQVKSQFDHLPAGTIKEDMDQAKAAFQPLVDLFEKGRQSGLFRDLPDSVLAALSFESCPSLARQQLLGLVELDEAMLEHCIAASWQAIKRPPEETCPTGNQLQPRD